MKKRLLTALLAVCMTVTTIGMDAQAYYQEETSQQNAAEAVQEDNIHQKEAEEIEKADANLTDTEEIAEETNLSDTEETNLSDTEEIAEETNPSNTEEITEEADLSDTEEIAEDTNPSNTEENAEETNLSDTEETKEKGKKSRGNFQQQAVLNYIIMEKESLETPDTQNVVASLGQAGSVIANAKLVYQNETTGAEVTVDAVNSVQDMVLFSIDFSEVSQSGSYVLKSIAYTENGIEMSISLSQEKMNVRFGVNTAVETEPDDVIINEDMLKEVEANVVTMDGNGNTVSENTVKSILNQPQAASFSRSRAIAGSAERGAKNLVVVLDPGHDDTHAGARYYGAGEEDLVLKIAKYCRDELKKYSGITVYMVRDSGACPYAGTVGSSADCNARRVEFAASKKADVYVSFHLNASPSSVPGGVGVYYPNSSYRPDIGQEGKELATEIYQKLNALGLSLWAGGALIRNSEDGTTYPDGSLSDYLGVIRRSKLAGIPAVLIEHAFLSSYSDYMNFLSSDAKLKKLGVADANAIVSYYGLSIKGNPSINYVQSKIGGKLRVSWRNMGDGVSYEIYKSRRSDSGYTKAATITNQTFFEDSDIITGKRYFYKVRIAYQDGTKSGYSPVRSGIALGKVKLNYVKSIRSKKLELNWNKMTGASGYNIYRRAADSNKFELIKTINDGNIQKYADIVPNNNVVYYYTVRAVNTSGGKIGCGSASLEKYGRAVEKPSVKSVVSVTDEKLKVSWNKIDGARGYMITRSTEKNGNYSVIANITSGSVTIYEDSSIETGKTYYYRVASANIIKGRKGYSGYSVPKQGCSIEKTAIKWVKSMDDNTLEIKWNKVPKAYGYKIRRSDKENGTYKTIAIIRNGNTEKYRDKTITAGKKYYYIVQTANKIDGISGGSGFCKPVVGRAVEKTSINYVRSFSSNKMEIAWKEVSGAYGYRIKRSTSLNGTYTTIASMTGKNITSYQDKVTSGKKYYYKVEVINSVNRVKGMSGYSRAIAGRALETTKIESVKAHNEKKITLKWKPVIGAAGYQIKRSASKNGPYELVANVNGENMTTYSDNTVKANTTYYYSIRGFKKSFYRFGYSSYSTKIEAPI